VKQEYNHSMETNWNWTVLVWRTNN